jgi:hypothetical protein
MTLNNAGSNQASRPPTHATVARSDANQLQVALFAPRQELLNSMEVVFAGGGVGEFAVGKFLSGKLGSLADTLHDLGCVPS